MSRPLVVIVSPAVAAANNGNWRTAERWRAFLQPAFDVRIAQAWSEADGGDVMVALHARRSADAIQAWARAHPGHGLAVVLTGTDLYQDLAVDAQAQRSLDLAQQLVVLQERGIDALGAGWRAKSRVIYQSAPAHAPTAKPRDRLEAVMVGHLRQVKAPQTLFEAARLLRPDEGIHITHIGDAAAEPQLGDLARATEHACPHYRWLGPLPHEQTLERIRNAHLLVHTSLLEGGAHVVLEAVVSGTPVLASAVPGNIGMLGQAYAGYFPHGDAPGLAHLLRACRAGLAGEDPASGLLARLGAQCALRMALFDPEVERAAVLQLVQELVPRP